MKINSILIVLFSFIFLKCQHHRDQEKDLYTPCEYRFNSLFTSENKYFDAPMFRPDSSFIENKKKGHHYTLPMCNDTIIVNFYQNGNIKSYLSNGMRHGLWIKENEFRSYFADVLTYQEKNDSILEYKVLVNHDTITEHDFLTVNISPAFLITSPKHYRKYLLCRVIKTYKQQFDVGNIVDFKEVFKDTFRLEPFESTSIRIDNLEPCQFYSIEYRVGGNNQNPIFYDDRNIGVSTFRTLGCD